MYWYRNNGIGCFSLLSNSQDAPRRFKHANTGSGTQKRYAPPSDNIDHSVRTHMTHANRRDQQLSQLRTSFALQWKPTDSMRAPATATPSYPQPLTTNTFSVPCLSNKHKKWDALYRVSRSRRSGSKRSRLPRYDSNTQLATGEAHTHTLSCWFTRLANDQCRHTQINTRKRSMQTHALLCCNHIKCHLSSSSGICITASRSIASTTGPSPQMCVW